MSGQLSRRAFLHAAAATTVGTVAGTATTCLVDAKPGPLGVVVISSANGLRATAKAANRIEQGDLPVDAVVAGVAIVEADPNDDSVGYGGLPNERGIVELDASVMDGTTHDSGAVAALQRIRHPAQVALKVMRRTDHAMLVGAGALEFARAHGFPEENLLTEKARRNWLKWKETHSDNDDWLPPLYPSDIAPADPDKLAYTYGTINCLAVDACGNLGGVTTTSGLSYKLPGRVGDSPIIGAGLYVDNAVGAAGATGRGEAVIKNCGAFAAVELMRQGLSPADAAMEVIKRIVAHTSDPRLLRPDGRPNFDVKMYALGRDGTFGAASIWSGGKFAVNSNGQNRLEDAAYLYEHPAAG